MENSTKKLCAICKEEIKSDHLSYSCNHSFCVKCYPYILFSLLKSTGITKEFFMNPNNKFSCMICGTGKRKFPFETLFQVFLKEKPSDSKNQGTNKKLCDGCEGKQAERFCNNCNLSYCDECLEQIHKPKMFQSHKIINLEQMENFKEAKTTTEEKFQCSCPAKHYLTSFCLSCQTATCLYCLKYEHDRHPQISLEGALVIRQNNVDLQAKMERLIQNYSDFMENFLKKVNISRTIYNENFNKLIEEIINELISLRSNNEEKGKNEFEFLNSQFQLIQSSLVFMKEELGQNCSNLHPNKQFQINNLMDDFEEKKLAFNIDWEINYEEIYYI